MAQSILVLEDDPDVCQTIKTVLERVGYKVQYFYHADEAWRSMHQTKPDLLLLDIGLPDVHGWEFARRMHVDGRVKDLPIVVLTGKKGFLDRMSAKLYPVKGFVQKPFKHYDLSSAVQAALK